MSEFAGLLLDLFFSAVKALLPFWLAALAAVVLGALLWKGWGKKKVSVPRCFFLWVLLCYLAGLVYVTVFRSLSAGYLDFGRRQGNVSLHLFRAFREAWNGFTLQSWLNPILNTAVFVPLGVLLPLTGRRLRKGYVSLLAALGLSLLIESAQFLLGAGTFDVDDLVCNTLGAVLGWAAVTMVLLLLEKAPKKAYLPAGAVLGSFLAVVLGFVGLYFIQPYGNLSIAPSYTVDVRDVAWTVSCDLPDQAGEAPICKGKRFSKADCDALLQQWIDVVDPKKDPEFPLDSWYYDDQVMYTTYAAPGWQMTVSYADGSFTLCNNDVFRSDIDYRQADRQTLTELLSEIQIEIPAEAEFSYDGEQWHTFTLPATEEYPLGGTIRVSYLAEGKIKEVEYRVPQAEEVEKAVPIRSPKEAYERLQKGQFSMEDDFAARTAQILSYTLTYQADSKGFFQPVYAFTVLWDGDQEDTVAIPAIP